jgi:hypothetical protein
LPIGNWFCKECREEIENRRKRQKELKRKRALNAKK